MTAEKASTIVEAMAADPARALERNSPEVEAAFEAAPPEAVAEIVDGVFHLHARPVPRHGRASARLARYLGPFDDDPHGWVILPEPELHLGPRPDKLAPDLAGWRRERMPELPDEAALTLAPDWVCEVLSPSTERVDRGGKMRIYRREGVRRLWLLNPTAQTLETYRNDGTWWVLLETYEGDDRVRAEPFDAVELDLARLWAR
jgi:Uma2 family endonuclease